LARAVGAVPLCSSTPKTPAKGSLPRSPHIHGARPLHPTYPLNMSWIPSLSTARHVFYGILIGFSLSIASTSVISAYKKRKEDISATREDRSPIELRSDEVLDGVTGLIGKCHHRSVVPCPRAEHLCAAQRKYTAGSDQLVEQCVGRRDSRKGGGASCVRHSGDVIN
jgi:hypothetical protein